MIPPLSCAVQFVFKNAALATSGLLPCDYFKRVFDSLCGLWFLPLLMWGFPHRYNASFINISQHLWIHWARVPRPLLASSWALLELSLCS